MANAHYFDKSCLRLLQITARKWTPGFSKARLHEHCIMENLVNKTKSNIPCKIARVACTTTIQIKLKPQAIALYVPNTGIIPRPLAEVKQKQHEVLKKCTKHVANTVGTKKNNWTRFAEKHNVPSKNKRQVVKDFAKSIIGIYTKALDGRRVNVQGGDGYECQVEKYMFQLTSTVNKSRRKSINTYLRSGILLENHVLNQSWSITRQKMDL